MQIYILYTAVRYFSLHHFRFGIKGHEPHIYMYGCVCVYAFMATVIKIACDNLTIVFASCGTKGFKLLSAIENWEMRKREREREAQEKQVFSYLRWEKSCHKVVWTVLSFCALFSLSFSQMYTNR